MTALVALLLAAPFVGATRDPTPATGIVVGSDPRGTWQVFLECHGYAPNAPSCQRRVDLSRWTTFSYNAFVSSCDRDLETCAPFSSWEPFTGTVLASVNDGIGSPNVYRSSFYMGAKTTTNQLIQGDGKEYSWVLHVEVTIQAASTGALPAPNGNPRGDWHFWFGAREA